MSKSLDLLCVWLKWQEGTNQVGRGSPKKWCARGSLKTLAKTCLWSHGPGAAFASIHTKSGSSQRTMWWSSSCVSVHHVALAARDGHSVVREAPRSRKASCQLENESTGVWGPDVPHSRRIFLPKLASR